MISPRTPIARHPNGNRPWNLMTLCPYPESTEGMRRCWSGQVSEGMGVSGTALIPTDWGGCEV